MEISPPPPPPLVVAVAVVAVAQQQAPPEQQQGVTVPLIGVEVTVIVPLPKEEGVGLEVPVVAAVPLCSV